MNLDDSIDRRRSFEDMLVKQGLESLVFDRFSAMRPDSSIEHKKRGLKTEGQLGLWITFARLFQMVGAEGGEAYVLVAEDDSVMSSKLPSFLEKNSEKLASSQRPFDIVFLSYFVNIDLIRSLSSIGFTLSDSAHYLFPASRFYLACTDCFLLSQAASACLGEMLQRSLGSGVQLPPVDIAIRNFIRQGIICSSIVFPPLAATSLEGASTINVGQDSLLLNSQAATGILRSVVSGIITPAHGIGCLENIFTSSAPNIGGSFDNFVGYFASLSSQMVRW